jgi:hypothetical protein
LNCDELRERRVGYEALDATHEPVTIALLGGSRFNGNCRTLGAMVVNSKCGILFVTGLMIRPREVIAVIRQKLRQEARAISANGALP